MKKTIIAILLFGCIAIQCSAQEKVNNFVPGSDFRDMIQLGVKLGANYSSIYNVEGMQFNTDPRFGLATGVFVAIPMSKLFGFQPEILISQKGFHATGELLGNKYEFIRTTTFADIPLMISFKPTRSLNLLAGSQYSYLISEHDAFSSGSITLEQETEFKNADVRRNNVSFSCGLDYDLNHFVISFRSGWDISSNKGDGSASSPRYKNAWYQGTLGYRLVNN
ncbi:MAG: PorT family protein [Bacteroidetes bacterium]|nr:PorT family protein [Bacteroidota bacterium]